MTRREQRKAHQKRDLRRLTEEFMRENPDCFRCQSPADEVHHARGRGANLLRRETFRAVCRMCHEWAHEHPMEARAIRLSGPRSNPGSCSSPNQRNTGRPVEPPGYLLEEGTETMLNSLTVLVVLVALLAIAYFKHFLCPAASDALPYRKKDYLLTKAERSFYEVLRAVVVDEMLIFAKVRLADLVWLPKGTTNWQAHFNRVQSKHIDFVLCDLQKIAPVLAIELDDASHGRDSRQRRDLFVNAALNGAGLPILRVKVKRAYAPNELAKLIRESVSSRVSKSTPHV